MTKQELLLAIQNSSLVLDIIKEPELKETLSNTKRYEIALLMNEGENSANKVVKTIYTVNEDTPEETAYLKSNEYRSLYPVTTVSFKDKLKELYANMRVQDPNIWTAKEIEIDEDGKRAVAQISFKDQTWDGVTMPIPPTIKVLFEIGENPDGSLWFAPLDDTEKQKMIDNNL